MMKQSDTGSTVLSLKQTVKFLKQNDDYIILTHASPDGDTLGSAYALFYALKELGKTVQVLCPDEIPKKYGYFVAKTDTVPSEKATVIAVDVADANLLGSLREEFGSRVDLNIDHHISNTHFAKNLYLDVEAGAAAESVFDIIEAFKVRITDTMAKAVYTGMVTDTGCFKYSNVTAKTHIIASKLYSYDIKASVINKLMFDTKSRRLLELERMVLDTAEFHFGNKCMMITVTQEMQQKTGCTGTELEGLVVISRSVEGVAAGITLKQTGENQFKVSLRTYDPLNSSEICKKLGGGGHKAAAGASVSGTLAEAKEQVLRAVKENMEEAYAGVTSVK